MRCRQRPGGTVQVAGAAVVAKPLPEEQHILLGSRGQVRHAGKRAHETLEVGDYGRDLRLLQHDLADPDAIRVAVAAPRAGRRW